MKVSNPANAAIAILLCCSFACSAGEPVKSKHTQRQPHLLFNRLEGGEYYFYLQNETSKPISLLVDNLSALDTAAECRSKHKVSRGATFFSIRDPDAPNHALPNTDLAPGARMELKVSSPILSASVNLLAKFRGGLCRIRIQLQQPNKIIESNEFEP